jgi:hypothetical protein
MIYWEKLMETLRQADEDYMNSLVGDNENIIVGDIIEQEEGLIANMMDDPDEETPEAIEKFAHKILNYTNVFITENTIIRYKKVNYRLKAKSFSNPEDFLNFLENNKKKEIFISYFDAIGIRQSDEPMFDIDKPFTVKMMML